MNLDAKQVNLKTSKKILKLIFEEGDEVVTGIKQVMMERNLREISLVEVTGLIKKAKIEYFEKGKFKVKIFENIQPLRINGTLKLSFGELYGVIKLSFNPKNPLTGTLVTGIAEQELTITANYYELE